VGNKSGGGWGVEVSSIQIDPGIFISTEALAGDQLGPKVRSGPYRRNTSAAKIWTLFFCHMTDPSSELPDELLLEIVRHSISTYGLVDDFLATTAAWRLTVPQHIHFPSLDEWKRRTRALVHLSGVAKSWFRVATPLLYEIIRIYRPAMVSALIRASSEAAVLFKHTKHLSFEMYYSRDTFTTGESAFNSFHAFKELASRCPNLRVLQNRCAEPDGDQQLNVFPCLRLYDGPFHPIVASSQNTLQYLILPQIGAHLQHNMHGLSFPLLRVLDLTRTDWRDHRIILSWDMPTLRDLRGRFHQQRVSYDIIAKVAKTLRRLQIQTEISSPFDEGWHLSGSEVDAPIPLPHLSEIVVHYEVEASIGLRPRYFQAFCSLDSLRSITTSVPGNLRAFVLTLSSFVWIFDGPATRAPEPVTIRIGEASLKPQLRDWSSMYHFTLRTTLYPMVQKLTKQYKADVLFAMPDGTYDSLHWFEYEVLSNMSTKSYRIMRSNRH
jgi:hypothetical protein